MESGKRWFLRVQLFFDLINDVIMYNSDIKK